MQNRDEFPAFPREPYPIQLQFMQQLYSVLNTGGIGLFESPTGTGKTLSLLCGTLTWLADQRIADAVAQPSAAADSEDDLPDWAKNVLETQASSAIARPISPVVEQPTEAAADEDAEYLLEAYKQPATAAKRSRDDTEERPDTSKRKRQLIYCSRTHSQLGQVVSELRNMPFAEDMTAVVLASRSVLCINDSVRALGYGSAINDRCSDLLNKQRKAAKPAGRGVLRGKKRAQKCGCPYCKRAGDAAEAMLAAVLDMPLDIEELGSLGKKLGVCPYYAARDSVPDADVLLLPYNALLSKETREALGVCLEGNVVIFDEAHNLVDAVTGCHAATLTSQAVSLAIQQLELYFSRFAAELHAENRERTQTLIHCARKLQAAMSFSTMHSVDSFLEAKGLDNLNMYALLQWAYETRLAHKVAGYAASCNQLGERGAIYSLLSFMRALGGNDEDGCVLVGEDSLKYILLNAAAPFTEVVQQAHAVILASGTLTPVEITTSQLFPHTPQQDIHLCSFSHVVPADQLFVTAVGKGPTGELLDFRFKNRANSALLDELGRVLLNVATVTPQGMVVFFGSFSYMEQVLGHWERTGLLEKVRGKKEVFREPTSNTDVAAVLAEYAAACAGRGALLMGVVGGKLAEGINFGDEMGRCVLMVGLPYPDQNSPELKRRIAYINETQGSVVGDTAPGQAYYEGLCMKAVNQCIGRVIRHRGDFAAIVLLDVRYTVQQGVRCKLPGWIRWSFVECEGFGAVQRGLKVFFVRLLA